MFDQRGDGESGNRVATNQVIVPTMGAAKISFLGMLSVGMLLVGAWAGIVPYAGPLFGFGQGDVGAWQWTNDRAPVSLVPGAAAVLAGLLLMASLFFMASNRGRGLAAFAGLLAAVAGAWLVLGPSAYGALTGSTSLEAPHFGAHWDFVIRVGYHLGPGLLLAVFGALTMGLLPRGGVRRQVAAG